MSNLEEYNQTGLNGYNLECSKKRYGLTVLGI